MRALVRRCDDGRFRLLIDVVPGFATEADAGDAAAYLLENVRVRLSDVLDRLNEHASAERLAERIPRPAPVPMFLTPAPGDRRSHLT